MPVPLEEIMARFTPEERAKIERGAQRIIAESRTLAELRKALGVTQADLAKALKTTQGNIAQIESKDDVMISTVERVVKALGGRLVLRVEIPGHPPATLRLGRSKGKRTLKAERRRPTKVIQAGVLTELAAKQRRA